jgi:class 3 adenylate cyclase
MAEATVKVASGDLEVDLSSIRRSDEVGMLAGAFTRMVSGLRERDRIRDTFGRYLTREVVNRLLEAKDGLQLGGESREITMIMSDLRGFTSLTSTMPPEEVIALLNRYFEKMFEILIDHHGIIDEIIGDAVLAFFGAPEPIEDHPGLAVACAVRMQTAMDDINDLNEAQGWPRVEMGVAVNTGRVVVGNIGSEKRAKYGAVGSEVNFTGRIESCTVGGQVLISRATYERLSDIIDIRNIVQVEMKGIAGKVTLYDVKGIKGSYDAYLPERDDKPVLLQKAIKVKVYPIDQKILTGTATAARITHASLTSAIMILSKKLEQWQDIRMLLDAAELAGPAGVVYAKVVSITETGYEFEATVRFTSVSPEAYRVFRHESGMPLSPRTTRISGESE